MQQTPVPEVRFGEWITEGWNMFAEQWQTWVLMSLIFFATAGLPYIILTVFLMLSLLGTAGGGPPESFIALFYLGFFAIMILMLPLYVYLLGGMHRTALKQLRGESISVRDLFSAGDCFLPLLGATVLVGFLAIIGFILCIIPGYIVMAMFFFVPLLIVDRRLPVTEAMRQSSDLVKQKLLMFTLFYFLVALIAQLGTYVCYIGILATFPLQFTMGIVAYRDCFGVQGARSFVKPRVAAPVYGPSSVDQSGYPPTGIVCPNCGSPEAQQGAVFCSRCGGRLA
jgi:hypothetical protein